MIRIFTPSVMKHSLLRIVTPTKRLYKTFDSFCFKIDNLFYSDLNGDFAREGLHVRKYISLSVLYCDRTYDVRI